MRKFLRSFPLPFVFGIGALLAITFLAIAGPTYFVDSITAIQNGALTAPPAPAILTIQSIIGVIAWVLAAARQLAKKQIMWFILCIVLTYPAIVVYSIVEIVAARRAPHAGNESLNPAHA